MAHAHPTLDPDAVVRLWLHRQGLARPRGSTPPSRDALRDHLLRTGALQLDSVNAVDRAHYLTVWSRFGPYDREALDRWVYEDGIAYEYWGHEASILPIEHLPLGLRRMRSFPTDWWANQSWWKHYRTSPASKRRVLRRLRRDGPLESADFEHQERSDGPNPGGSMPLPKEDRRSLKLLWHDGRVAIRERRHFRCVYDLSERVYPAVAPATTAEYEDSWLLRGLSGNGVAREAHLTGYITGPALRAADRKRVLARALRKGRVVEVRVRGHRGAWYALPEHLEALDEAPEPRGTHLVCPFDSLLWQRKRAAELLDFHFRLEIYVPEAKREFGYYAMPILHDGRLVGQLDPKLHRNRAELAVNAIRLEDGFEADAAFHAGLAEALDSLRGFTGADRVRLPRGWGRRLPGL